MDDYTKIIEPAEVMYFILDRHKGKDFVQCLKCNAYKINAKELARTLYYVDCNSDDAFDIDMDDYCWDFFNEITTFGFPDECCVDGNFNEKWTKENEHRFLDFVDEDVVRINYKDVILRMNIKCDCFW